MKTGTIALIAVGGFIAYKLMQLGTASETVQIVLDSVTPNSVLDYTLGFKIQNVSNASLTIRGIDGTVSVNGQQLGTFSDFTQRVIGPTSQQEIDIDFSLSLLNLPSNVYDMLSSGTLNFDVTGNANVNTLVLPFNLTNSVTV